APGPLADEVPGALAGDRRAGDAGSRTGALCGHRNRRCRRDRCSERTDPSCREQARPDAVDDADSLTDTGYPMRSLDQVVEQSARSLAQRTSRRSLLGLLGRLLTGAAVLPLLPIDRGSRAHANETHPGPDSAESCDYWKYCAIDGFLCACCGGTSTACPPGTAPSPISWVGTCHNARD